MSVSTIVKKQEAVQQHWINIYESRQTNKILTGILSAVEQHGDSLCGVVFYDEIKILIPKPVINLLPSTDDEEENNRRDRMMYAIMGAKIDFVVTEIDRENSLVVASRAKAMEIRQKELPKLKENQKISCRIMAVGAKIAIAEAYGVEVKLVAKDVSWGYITDLRDCLSAGDELDAIVSNIDIENRTFKLSIRDTIPNPYENVDKLYIQNCEYLATVSLIREGGVFVRLKEGVDAMCPHPGWTNLKLNVGDQVYVRIRSIDASKKRIKAIILRLIKRAQSI